MATVLIVEDDTDIRTAYTYALGKFGFTVVEAMEGGEAIEKLEKHHPDVVLLDMLMPGISGLDFLREVDAPTRYPQMVVIAFSNIDTPRVVEQAKELGAAEYLIKVDVTPRQIVDIIHEHLK